MGLGKTMQVITEMLYLKSQFLTPIIVVAPISLLANWQRECKSLRPHLMLWFIMGLTELAIFGIFQNLM